MIRNLAKKFSAFDSLVDNVIIELKFQRGNFTAGAEILKTHSSMTLLRASSTDAQILLKMIRPRRQVTAALGCRIQSAEKTWRIFTASGNFRVRRVRRRQKRNSPSQPADCSRNADFGNFVGGR
ncbi:MAG: hypothetical protein IKN27_07695 [Selenomonadaceae bacterium]|nr:hypothetical protein [Selenomonadaceae bacterium]